MLILMASLRFGFALADETCTQDLPVYVDRDCEGRANANAKLDDGVACCLDNSTTNRRDAPNSFCWNLAGMNCAKVFSDTSIQRDRVQSYDAPSRLAKGECSISV